MAMDWKTGVIGLGAVLAVGVLMIGARTMGFGQEGGSAKLPAPAIDEHGTAHSETAVFAGGCFWGVQTVFQRVKGVTATTAGYSGGSAQTATYEQVSSESTGHGAAGERGLES